MGRKIAAFFTALNRALFIRLSCVSSSLSARRLLERRARTRTHAVYNYWQFFENDSNPCVKEKFVKAMKILIQHGPTNACRVHCLYCAGTIVVISHASLSFTLSLRLSSYFYAPRKNFANESSSLRCFIPLSLLGKKFDWGRGEGGGVESWVEIWRNTVSII